MGSSKLIALALLLSVTAQAQTATNTPTTTSTPTVTPTVTPTPTQTGTPCRTIIVNNTGDADLFSGDTLCETALGNGICTLRAALRLAGVRACLPTEIDFGINDITDPNCNSGTHLCTIAVGSDLPELAGNVANKTRIEGTTQPHSSCGDLWGGTPPDLKILVTSSNTIVGFHFAADDISIRGINTFGFFDGVLIDGGSARTHVACMITDSDNTGVTTGINVSVATDAWIGGGAGDGNVVTGQGLSPMGSPGNGVNVQFPSTGALVQGNFIGIEADGVTCKGNSNLGVIVLGPSNLTLDHNLISCNAADGIGMDQDNGGNHASNIRVIRNGIGTDLTETLAKPNCATDGAGAGGVVIHSPADNTTLGGDASLMNVISGNHCSGVNNGSTTTVGTFNNIGVDINGSPLCNLPPQILDSGPGTFSNNNVDSCDPTNTPTATPTSTKTPTPIVECVRVRITPGTDCDNNCVEGNPAPGFHPTPTPIGPLCADGQDPTFFEFIPPCSAPTPLGCGAGCCFDQNIPNGLCNSDGTACSASGNNRRYRPYHGQF